MSFGGCGVTESRYAEETDLHAILSRSGLEDKTAIRDGGIAAPTKAATLGFRLHEASHWRVDFRAASTAAHCIPMGTVGGGLNRTLLYLCMGCAVMTSLPSGKSKPPPRVTGTCFGRPLWAWFWTEWERWNTPAARRPQREVILAAWTMGIST